MSIMALNSTQYTSENFVLAAGSVLFRRSPSTGGIQVCLIYHKDGDEWLLPKGRKDRGESMDVTAVRETFEETGYDCELLPCRMPTRAPEIGINTIDVAVIGDNLTEPFAVTIRELGESKGTKIIWWFLTRVKSNVTERATSTQTDSENFDSQFFDINEAILQLSFPKDRDLVHRAASLVENPEVQSRI